MEWFWNMVDHFQKSAVGVAIQSFSPIDWILFLAIFWGLVQGSRKGFSDMFGKLLGVFLVSMLTLSFYSSGAAFLHANLPGLSLKIANPIAFFLLAVFLWLSVSWCINVFGKLFRIEAQGLLKTLGGMAFGVLHMMLLLSFLVQFLLFLPIDPLQKVFKKGHTYTGYTIAQFVPDIHAFIVSPFHKPALKNPVETNKAVG